MIRKGDLVDIGDKDYDERSKEEIMCRDCNWEYRATRSDYPMLDDDELLQCSCGSNDLFIGEYSQKLKIIKG